VLNRKAIAVLERAGLLREPLAEVLVARAAKVGAARAVVDKAPEPWLLNSGERDWLQS